MQRAYIAKGYYIHYDYESEMVATQFDHGINTNMHYKVDMKTIDNIMMLCIEQYVRRNIL